MTPMEAAEDAFHWYDFQESLSWEVSVNALVAHIPQMTPETRRKVIRMLEARLAGYSEENIAAAKAKIEMLRAAT